MQQIFDALPQAGLEGLARALSLWVKPGQLILLEGDVGAGKSTFARAFIRELAGADVDVPSPTFTLLQSYDMTRVPVAHVDLYRLKAASEADELGIAELLDTHVVLIEWPERMPSLPVTACLTLSLSGSGAARRVEMEAQGEWIHLLARNDLASSFIAASGYRDWRRSFFEGDASSRRYEMLTHERARVLLMDMPQRPDGPIVKDGLPYSAIAHLAENISSVILVNTHLGSLGYSAPRILASDEAQGFAVIEYLGDRVFGAMLRQGHDMTEPMRAATGLLADMAERDWPQTVPPYDLRALSIEADLLPSWYWLHVNGAKPGAGAAEEFSALWTEALADIPAQSNIWTLRDFHSPNLLWLPERDGIQRVGLIDTQDCVYGHAAYDLASLIQDARVDVPPDLAAALLDHYCAMRAGAKDFDRNSFLAAYAILGAQRATKILGIFARLFMRDGKPQYLAHMPRVRAHLERNLAHPALGKLKGWYAAHLGMTHG
jgi:N-acetylmuramate 1-kinase